MTIAPKFNYVSESSDPFLALFPHRFDYIYAPHPDSDESPAWQTESRHPLSDRLIYQKAGLYGVRFGPQTNYCLLDIDAGSLYHPQRDPLAIARIVDALEPIGLVSYLACTSSYSGGLHLYLPFSQTQTSWELAAVMALLLSNAGFNVRPGQLELFPNPRPYLVDGHPSLFNAHRLPLQTGSYLLNQDFQPIWTDPQRFVAQWQVIQQRNAVDSKILKRILKQVNRSRHRVRQKAEKFMTDLNAEIEMGWTDSGQTNRLLGRITMRTYIFHHVIHGGDPLTGQALVNEIVAVARSLPGYYEFCNHQKDIEDRATEWARCIESSRYFPYGDIPKGKYKPKELDQSRLTIAPTVHPNQRRLEATRDKIRAAMDELVAQNSLPDQSTARFNLLTQVYGVGGGSLYRHKDLWHPHFLLDHSPTSSSTHSSFVSQAELNQGLELSPVENPPDPPHINEDCRHDRVDHASSLLNPTSLLSQVGGNALSDLELGDRLPAFKLTTAGNVGIDQELSRALGRMDEPGLTDPWPTSSLAADSLLASASSAPCPMPSLPQGVPITAADIKAWLEAAKVARAQMQQEQTIVWQAQQAANRARYATYEQAYQDRMRQYLESDDPILRAEALRRQALMGDGP